MVQILATETIPEQFRPVTSLNKGIVGQAFLNGVIESGDNVYFMCAIGGPPEDKSVVFSEALLDPAPTYVGKGNVFREYVTVHSGTKFCTVIGDDCLFMTKSHVGHDAQIGDRVTVSPSAMIGGHCIIEDDVTIGMGAVIHQRTKIHKGAMIGMGSVVTHEVAPYSLVYGNPARPHDINWKKFKEHGEPWNELWNYNDPAFNEYYGVA